MNEYLWEFAQKLPSDDKFQILLKSALLQTASFHADVGKTNYKWMCRKCKTLWMHGYFTVNEIHSTNRYDNLLEKYNNMAVLTKKQQIYYDYMMSRKRTTVKYTCKMCSYKTRITTDNKEPAASPISDSITFEDTEQIKTKSKKKKRNRDLNAGLNIPSKINNAPLITKASPKPHQFSSKKPNELSALVKYLKKNTERMSAKGPLEPENRLKLFLQ